MKNLRTKSNLSLCLEQNREIPIREHTIVLYHCFILKKNFLNYEWKC